MRKLCLLAVLAFLSHFGYSQNEFYVALQKNDLPKVKTIIEANPDLLGKEREYSTFPMLEAASFGRLEIVKYLVEKGAKLDAKTSKNGDNAVLLIARSLESPNDARTKQFIPLLDYFADQKVNFSVTDKEGNGPLRLFADKKVRTVDVKNYVEVVNTFIKHGAKLTDKGNTCSLHKLLASEGVPGGDKKIDFGSFEAAKELVALGANVNEADDAKNTPLHVVLLNKRATDDLKVDIVKFLMEKGAKTNVKNSAKQSPEDLVKKESPLYDIIKKTKPKK